MSDEKKERESTQDQDPRQKAGSKEGSTSDDSKEEECKGVIEAETSGEEKLKITVISGQTIQKPGQSDDDVVDPYVEVELFGEPNSKQKCKTEYIKNNGMFHEKERV